MPYFDELVRQYMKQEPPDELGSIHGHDLAFVAVRVILGTCHLGDVVTEMDYRYVPLQPYIST